MREIILASHARMASGLKSSIELLAGDRPELHAVDCFVDGNEDPAASIGRVVDEALARGSEVIICTDLFGGSVNTAAMTLLERPGVHLVCGMNLPLVLQLVLDDGDDVAASIREAIAGATDAIKYCNDAAQAPDTSDDGEGFDDF